MSDKTVLVVDDDPAVLQMIDMVLREMLGVSSMLAESGRDAMEQVKRGKPTLVLLDLIMPPSMDGLNTAKALKSDPATRSIPIIALSCDAPARTAIENGCDDFIAKPFELDFFIEKVRKHLNDSGSGRRALASA